MAKEGSGRKEEKIVNITRVEGKERGVEMDRKQDKKGARKRAGLAKKEGKEVEGKGDKKE